MVEAVLIQFAPSRFLRWKTSIPPNKAKKIISYAPQLNLFHLLPTCRVRIHRFSGGVRAQNHGNTINKVDEIEAEAEVQLEKGEEEDFSSGHEVEDGEEDQNVVDEEFSHASAYRARRDEKDYDRDPEIAEILGNCFDDPKKAQSKVEERIRRKRNKILHTKTGSATSMKVTFRKRSEDSLRICAENSMEGWDTAKRYLEKPQMLQEEF